MTRLLLTPVLALIAAVLPLLRRPPAPAGPEPKPAPLSTAATRRSGIEAERGGRWQEARAALEKALQAEPSEPETLYALSVCLAQGGDPPAALRDLAAALKSGFQDYRALEADAALNPLRALPEFAALIRNAAERRDAFDADLESGVRESYRGTPLQVRRFSAPRIVVVTDLGDHEAEQLASALAAVETRQRAGLFSNGLRHAIVVHAAKPADGSGGRLPGLYSPASRTLDVNITLPFGATAREFVRALHYDDQAAEGQVHAAWMRAGIAALYERTDSGTGAPRAVLDWRLDPLRESLGTPGYLPLARLLSARDARVDDAATGEARYLLYWLQQNGDLPAFYRAYVDRYDEDPTGKQALEAVCRISLPEVEKQWLAYLRGPIPGP